MLSQLRPQFTKARMLSGLGSGPGSTTPRSKTCCRYQEFTKARMLSELGSGRGSTTPKAKHIVGSNSSVVRAGLWSRPRVHHTYAKNTVGNRAADPDSHGSALIFPPGSRSRREKFSNKNRKSKEICNNCNFFNFKTKFAQAPLFLHFEQSFSFFSSLLKLDPDRVGNSLFGF